MIQEKLSGDNLLTRKQAAGYLQVCLTTFDRLSVPKIRFGRCVRFRKTDLQAFIDSQIEGNKPLNNGGNK
ncbi:helix-turn-helix domain-containing protein [Brucepastera parasyntrophica]|uniref:helix-turn-helix transcriptional regulator n=1 Tax=Brucepastera parasyntrophica TaxID=2880008 RepID=UPI0021093996|nr:helix-turn-helix domain-containing protein [Brucepastera parasyntrophica]ULQ59174.1 helix-turn-helix domain-containing protein [Brucepastera parasyntrophica]